MDQDVTVVAQPAGSTRRQLPDQAPDAPATEPEVVDELLVEEVSIDGMCGVY
jgi:mycofactocin precursor